MSRGVFSADFASKFEDVLNIHFEDFPSRSGEMPDPKGVVEAQDTPDSVPPDLEIPPTNASMQELPVDVFEFDFSLPETVSPKAVEHMPSAPAGFPTFSAGVTDYGPLWAPGGPGGGGGGGKPSDGGGGGGGGGGKKGGVTPYTSGDADTNTVDHFNIQLAFTGDYSSAAATALVGYLKASADFLSNIITTGFTDDPAMFKEGNQRKTFLVDDLYIEVKLGNLGPLIGAETGIYAGNDWNGNGTVETFYGATMTFNSLFLDDLESNGTLDDVVLHEMLHALGFGLWDVADNDLSDGTATTPGTVYTGAGADGWFLEDIGGSGSVGSHWKEATYDKELMTSVIEDSDTMYLSYQSIATLKDLKVIDVNTDNGTGYTLASDWQAQIDVLNASGGPDGGIDLDAWAALNVA